MKPRIEKINEKKLVGQRIRTSLTNNKTEKLWLSFMALRKEITNNLTSDLFSLQIYGTSYFDCFDPSIEFEKWALIEVADFSNISNDMETFILMGGQYAVFSHKGKSNDNSIFQYIFSNWLPNSQYQLDDRPHFEILGKKYKNNDPNSEEEIWIPIKYR